MRRLNHRIRILVASWRGLGLWATAKAILAQLSQYNPQKDTAFDKKYGTDTTGIVEHEGLDIADPQAFHGATYYVSVPARFVRYMLGNLDIDFQQWAFVDIGSGKGRILLVASDFPFRSITGVEISPKLGDIANRNIQIYKSSRQKCRNFKLECLDAQKFHPTADNTVFHFYHPFERDILIPVLRNIHSAFQSSGKKALLVYVWTHVPSLFEVIEAQGFKKVKYEQTANSRWQYAVFST